MSALTKKDVVEELVGQLGIERKVASEGMEAFVDIIKSTLEKGEEVSLSGFGKFNVRQKRTRQGRNPKTGEAMAISERRSISFHLSKVLREKLEKD
jgi:integration host factor subunit alpha